MGKNKNAAISKKKTDWKAYFKRYWQLYALVALPIIYLVIFKYLPMKNVVIAFKEYKLNMKLSDMPLSPTTSPMTGRLGRFSKK